MVLPDPDKSRVVLIGASRFTDPELPDLPAVRANLDGLAACLGDIGRCTVVADPESLVALIDPVHDAAAEAEDTLLIYYAGHGLVHPRTLGLLLAVVGSTPGRTHTAVPYDVVRENVLDSPAARKVVILDCCYSGRAFGGMADPTTAVANEATVEGTYLLASAPPNKQALSPPGERFTAFTGALLTLLKDGVPHGPPLLQLDLIYRHVRDALKRAARPEPQLRTDNTAGELALVRNPWHRAASPLTPILDVPIIDLGAADPARHKAVRRSLKAFVRGADLTDRYACPVCQATVTGQNLIRHFDKHTPIQTASLDPDALDITLVPTVLDNRYVLGEHITDKVRLATDTHTQQTVVVKQLPANQFDERALRLHHPAIVRVLDTVRTGIVMEYAKGRTLAEVIRLVSPMEFYTSVETVTKVCEALGYAHQNGVIHGTVNSSNIVLTPKGAIKMLHFGTGDATDLRSDVYSAGRLLFELLTGTPPTLRSPPLSQLRPGIPAWLDKIVSKALGPDLAERYQTASAMREDLMRGPR